MTYTAFFADRKSTHATLEAAQAWVAKQVRRYGLTATEAEAEGWTQIFNF